MRTFAAVLALLAALGIAGYAIVRLRGRRGIATATQRATYEVLHLAGLAAEPLSTGLTRSGAAKAARHLRRLIDAAGLAIVDGDETLGFDGVGEHHLPIPVSQATGKRLIDEAVRRGVPLTHQLIDDPHVCRVLERALVLVRPDQHVAWRGDEPPPDPAAVLDLVLGH